MLWKVGRLKIFGNFTVKKLVLESLFKKVAGLKPAFSSKRDSNTGAYL